MGCYETITFKCPSCGAELSAQSKGGPCAMGMYSHDSVPLDVATDANRHAPYICDCGKSWMFNIPPFDTRINLEIIEAK
jgi:transcription elongation factor Elf1